MSARIFDTVSYKDRNAQIVYIDDSSAQLKIDSQIFWVSREDLEALHRSDTSERDESGFPK
jgi:hypothetical protein